MFYYSHILSSAPSLFLLAPLWAGGEARDVSLREATRRNSQNCRNSLFFELQRHEYFRTPAQPPRDHISLALKHPIFSEIRRNGGQVCYQDGLLREAQDLPR